jgi:hypothetical protein
MAGFKILAVSYKLAQDSKAEFPPNYERVEKQ